MNLRPWTFETAPLGLLLQPQWVLEEYEDYISETLHFHSRTGSHLFLCVTYNFEGKEVDWSAKCLPRQRLGGKRLALYGYAKDIAQGKHRAVSRLRSFLQTERSQ